jgi:hypothetical protein
VDAIYRAEGIEDDLSRSRLDCQVHLFGGWFSFDQLGDGIGRKVGKFLWFHLVKPAAVHAPFLDKVLSGQCLQVRKYKWVEIGPGGQGRLQYSFGAW